jgi:hypothetical protein
MRAIVWKRPAERRPGHGSLEEARLTTEQRRVRGSRCSPQSMKERKSGRFGLVRVEVQTPAEFLQQLFVEDQWSFQYLRLDWVSKDQCFALDEILTEQVRIPEPPSNEGITSCFLHNQDILDYLLCGYRPFSTDQLVEEEDISLRDLFPQRLPSSSVIAILVLTEPSGPDVLRDSQSRC